MSIIKNIGDWEEILSPILATNYMDNLGRFIYTKYATELDITPANPVDIFNPFRNCSFENLKTVMIFDYPLTLNSNGIPMGTNNREITTEAELFYNAIGSELNIDNIVIDSEMKDLSNKGVLMLNYSPISVISGSAQGFYDQWDKFNRFIIKYISDHKDKVAFVLISHKSKKLKNLIDQSKHKIIKSRSLYYAIKKDRKEWNFSNFKDINKFISDGDDARSIVWNCNKENLPF